MKDVMIWDGLVRTFHWSLVLVFAFAFVSGEIEGGWHIASGYTILALVGIRIIWGFVGTRYARFSNFIFRPSVIAGYIKNLGSIGAKRYLGHNPAGGAMVLAILLVLLMAVLSGVAAYGADDRAGPLAFLANMPRGFRHDIEEVHEFLSHFMLILIFIHVTGVILESFLERENLVLAMITGRKRDR